MKPNAKLNPDSVRAMLLDLDAGMPVRCAAEKYKVGLVTVYLVRRGSVWNEVWRAVQDELAEPTLEELEAMIEANYATMPTT